MESRIYKAGDGEKIDGLYARFKERAESLSAKVFRTADTTEALTIIRKIIGETGATRVVAAMTPLVAELGLENISNISLYFSDMQRRAEEAELGISEMDLAVAESGTLMQDADDINKRFVSMLPPVHVALVATDSLVGSLRDALGRLGENPAGLPAYYAFISGPSRTADIERVLTIGVHGPGELFIVFIDQEGGAAFGY